MDRLRFFAKQLRNNGTDAEQFLWRRLRGRQLAGLKFRRQHPIAGFIVDFVCLEAQLVVELDGGQHVEAAAYDASRSRQIMAQGFRVLRFWDDEVFLRTDDVVAEIYRGLVDEVTSSLGPQGS